MKKTTLRDMGRALEDERLLVDRTAGQVDAGRINLNALGDALFPKAELVWTERGWDGMMQRMMEIKAHLDEQTLEFPDLKPELTEKEKEDLEAIANAVITAIQPLFKAFQQLAETFLEWMSEWMSTESYTALANLSVAIAEPEQQVETVELHKADGTVEHVPITQLPTPAVEHVGLMSGMALIPQVQIVNRPNSDIMTGLQSSPDPAALPRRESW